METETLSEKGRPLVSVVVLNWNGEDDTLVCLDSLAALTYPNFNVVLVDNGSTDDSLARLRSYNGRYPLTLLENGCNLGYAEGNNVGIRYAHEHGAEYIMLLNNDTVVDRGMLDVLVEAANNNPTVGILGARLLYMDRPDTVQFNGASWDDARLRFTSHGEDCLETSLTSEPVESDYACGAAMFFRAEVVRNVGLLDSRFFLVYEESDWCMRAQRAGFGCIIVPAAQVFHKVGASFDSEDSPLRAYFSTRNRFLWVEKNLGLRPLVRLFLRTIWELVPRFNISHDNTYPRGKRLYWAVIDYIKTLLGRDEDFRKIARRRGILDYLMRRFGNCPEEIRDVNRISVESRRDKQLHT